MGLEVGDTIAGDYELQARIGRGGFGEIWRARHVKLDRSVAVKTLRTDAIGLRNPGMVARFEREIELARNLEHPHIVRMYDAGKLDDGLLYIAMELIEGVELAELLEREGHLDANRAIAIVKQVLDALAEAHTQGVIHRDLKPQNIMLTRRGLKEEVVKVLDFGIAKPIDENAKRLTAANEVVGTPRYMAPEQLTGGEIGPWSDLYAIALILFECITGRPAVTGDSVSSVAMRQVTVDLRSSFPPALVGSPLGDLLERASAKNPVERFRSASEMYQALNALPDLSGVSYLTSDVSDLFGSIDDIIDDPNGLEPTLERSADDLLETAVATPAPALQKLPPSDPLETRESVTPPERRKTVERSSPPRPSPARPKPPAESTRPPSTSPSQSRGNLLWLIGIPLVVIIGGMVLSQVLDDAPAPAPQEATTPQPPPTRKVGSTPPPAVRLRERGAAPQTLPTPEETASVIPEGYVEVSLTANVEAEVYLGREYLGTTPFEITLEEGKKVTFTLERKGFKRKVIKLQPTSSETLHSEMEKE